jgi:hypothetical protein
MGTIGRVKRRMGLAPVKGLKGRTAQIKGGNPAEKGPSPSSSAWDRLATIPVKAFAQIF